MTQLPGLRVSPASTRSLLALEVAEELVDRRDWPYVRALVVMKGGDFETEGFTLFGSGSPDGIELVAAGKAHMAMINPSAMLTMAYRGTGPFDRALPVRVITVIPSYDQITFAVAESTGLKSLNDIREQKYPLRISVRGPRAGSVPRVADEICKAAGFTLDDVEGWGGEVRYDPHLPFVRMADMESGAVDCLIDEAVILWVERAAAQGIRFLPVESAIRDALAPIGLRPGVLDKKTYPSLASDVDAIDFSGFPVFTSVDVPDAEIRAICEALEARKDRIPWEGEGPLPLAEMCKSSVDGPFDVPLHPAAEAFWRERGYL
jgi:TRAP-type uncharacterized transport system substrate-binding protein